jgi:hypothetical protein
MDLKFYKVVYRFIGRFDDQIAIVSNLCIDSFLKTLIDEHSQIMRIALIDNL